MRPKRFQAPRFFDLPARVRTKICGRNAAAVRKAASRFGWENAATDQREVVADPEVDIIDIATPNDSHRDVALAAAAAGQSTRSGRWMNL